MKTNQKYKVTLCWYGENHEFYTSTTDKSQALRNGIYKLAQKLKRDLVFIRYQIYSGNKYLVEEVRE